MMGVELIAAVVVEATGENGGGSSLREGTCDSCSGHGIVLVAVVVY